MAAAGDAGEEPFRKPVGDGSNITKNGHFGGIILIDPGVVPVHMDQSRQLHGEFFGGK
jgi:hypothetical protein